MTVEGALTPIVVTMDWRVGRTRECERVSIVGGLPSGSPVSIKALNFNFLAFQLTYHFSVDTIVAYQILEKLWSQVFLVGSVGAAAAPRDSFGLYLNRWRLRMSETDAQLTDFLSEAQRKGIGVSETFMSEIVAVEAILRERQKQILAYRDSARSYLERTADDGFDRYARALSEQQELVKRFTAFYATSEVTRLGMVKVIPAQKPGLLISVSAIPQSFQGSSMPEASRTVRFLVRSKFPLVAHAGIGFSKLNRSTFDRVRTIGGADLYSQVADSAAKPDLILFLSVRPLSNKADWFAVSLGTQVASPGEKLFVGVSVEILKRIMFSGGVVSGTVNEGKNPVLDPLGDQLGTRELFEAVTKRRSWKPFVSASFALP